MIMLKNLTACLFALLLTPTAAADVILEIDLRDPNEVVFTSTLANSAITGSREFADGITLLSFFSTAVSGVTDQSLSRAQLGPADQLELYTRLYDSSKPLADLEASDLNVFANTGTTQEFDVSVRALRGSAAADLSALAGQFPSLGESGDILLGDTRASGHVLGQWSVTAIPEPSCLLFMTICFLKRGRTECFTI
jgi:hypothetical protein